MLHKLEFTKNHHTSLETIIMSNKHNYFGRAFAVLVLAGLFFAAPALAANNSYIWDTSTLDDGQYIVRNGDELTTVMEDIEPEQKKKEIYFVDNIILIADEHEFLIHEGTDILLDLQRHNFQGTGEVIFKGEGDNAKITIRGSSTAFNKGMQIQGNIIFDYQGHYSSSGVDKFGTDEEDRVTILLTAPGSKWKSSLLQGPLIEELPEKGGDPYREGTMVIGEKGWAEMIVASGNSVRNSETILGAYDPKGEGTLFLAGGETDWHTSGSFYVGFYGKGTLDIVGHIFEEDENGERIKIYELLDENGDEVKVGGVKTQTGSILVGMKEGSWGELTIADAGTVVSLYGRLDPHDATTSAGHGTMLLENEAILVFDEAAIPRGNVSGYAPKLSLGGGDSLVIDSKILGDAFPRIMEGDNLIYKRTGQILGLNDDRKRAGLDNSLTFKNSELEGQLEISMDKVTFMNGSVITPGLGQYNDLENFFGYFKFTTDMFHHSGATATEKAATTYIDFNVHGDQNMKELPGVYEYEDGTPITYLGGKYVYDKDVVLDKTDPGYKPPYLGDNGRDWIIIEGDAMLNGNIEFRPQSGYYTKGEYEVDDEIRVDFIHVDGDRLVNGSRYPDPPAVGYYDEIRLIPDRWFQDLRLERTDESIDLVMRRNTTPFTDANIADCYNLRGVGGALDWIYNDQTDRDWLVVLDWMWLMKDEQLRNAMRQLSGETRANSFFMANRSPWRMAFDRADLNEISRNQREELRKKQIDGCGVLCGQSSTLSKSDLWATPVYNYFGTKFDGNANGSHSSSLGLQTGYDRMLTPTSAIGAVFSYNHSMLNQFYSRVSLDDYLLGVHYNMLFQEKYEAKFWGSYGRQSYKMHRDFVFPHDSERMTSAYTGNTVALSSQVAMPVKWRSFTFRPLAALDLSVVQQNKAEERGYHSIALRYHNSTWAQLFGRLGVKADYKWHRWEGNATLSYSFLLLGDSAPTVRNEFYKLDRSPSFKVKGTDLGCHILNFGLGGHRWINEDRTRMCFLQYNGEYGAYSNGQTVSMGYHHLF